ncbi:MAG: GAF domain-containing protein [Fimbriimonadaceae bacterium]|nr:GAF domain-containing protein [Fimbriimonadaceae bacterium]
MTDSLAVVSAIQSLGESINHATSESSAYGELADALRSEFLADAVDVLILEQGTLRLVSSTHTPELVGRLQMAVGAGLTGQTLKEDRVVFIEDDLNDSGINAKVPGVDEPFRSAVSIPIGVGVIVLRRHDPWEMSDEDRNHAEVFAVALRGVISGFLAGHRVSGREEAGEVLKEVTETLTGSPYLEEILQHLVHLTARRFNYRVVTVRLLDERRDELVLRATQSENRAYQRKAAIPLGHSIAGQVLKLRRSMTVLDVTEDEDYIGHDLAAEQGLRSMVCVPLKVVDRVIGVMSCYTAERRSFGREEVNTLEALARQAAVSIEHAQLQVRNTLMQEMHHRVKNNLQQVASLLRLQMNETRNPLVDEALNDSLSRILAIAAVHDLLGREDLDHVGLRRIAESLVQHTQQSLIAPQRTLSFKVSGDDTLLTSGQATQVALILNELIQNAVEHGFPSEQSGEIHVTVETNENEVDVWVSDNGQPLPQGFSPDQGQLGMRIVVSLSRALGGEFKISEEFGWKIAHVHFTRSTGE